MDEAIAHQVFFELHRDLPREAPGNNEATEKAFRLISELPHSPQILDLGCGPGMQTLKLAQLTQGHVTAIDNHQPFLDQLQQQIEAAGVGDRITPLNADMANLPFSPASFDLIWAEGSAYILGFEKALKAWRALLKNPGYLAATEISWIHPNPPPAVLAFWQEEYPQLQNIEANLSLAKAAGYLPIAHFILPEEAWWQHYYTPLQQRLQKLDSRYANNPDALQVLELHHREIDLYRRYSHYYGYVFYILRKQP